MKNIMMILLGVGVSLSAFAGGPRVVGGGHINGGHARVIVVRPHAYLPYGYGYGYSPFYSPFYSYNSPFFSPYGFQQLQQPTQLDLNIQQINNDYGSDIADARHDKTLSRSERKQKIRELRHERANSIVDAKRNYYKTDDRKDDVIE